MKLRTLCFLTLWLLCGCYCVRECCRAYIAGEALKAGVVMLKKVNATKN